MLRLYRENCPGWEMHPSSAAGWRPSYNPTRFPMRRAIQVYPALLRASWERAVAYRAVFFVSLLNAIFPLVMMSIWIGLAQDEPIAGYRAADFAGYYLAAILVRRITGVGIVQEIERLVQTGEL